MSKSHIVYMVLVSLVAFIVWLIGEIIIISVGLSMTVAKIWIVAIFGGACVWSIRHFIREDRKAKEEEENDNYKGVY